MSKPAKGDMKTDGALKATKTTKAAKAAKDKPDVKASDAVATVRQRFLLSADALAALVDKLAAAGTPAVAPAWTTDGAAIAADAAAATGTARETEYRAVSGAAELALGERLPRLSLKQYFLPPTEVLFSYRRNGGDEVELTPAPTDFAAQVVLGARPCDTAALPIVDKVMNWDYADELWNARRAATTIFSLACGVEDDSCFCSAVFLDPATAQGADGLLTPVDDGYLVETLSDKGDAFAAAHPESFAALAAGTDKAATEQAERFRAAAGERVAGHLTLDHERLRNWLENHFDDPFWATLGLRCNGCGVCASVCPTCHCFDIVDEPESVGRGVRRRNWDTCQTCVFTLHASGHNPRADQNARYRQRIEHKFHVYPLKFGDVLCTGCGRCSRACPTSQDLAEILAAINAKAAGESAAPDKAGKASKAAKGADAAPTTGADS
jgi:ferredoxin